MKHRYSEWFLPFQIIVDTLLLNFAFAAALLARFGVDGAAVKLTLGKHYIILWLVFNILWFGLQLIFKPYLYSRVSFTIDKLLRKYLEVTIWHVGLIALFWTFIQGYFYSRGHLALTYIFFVLLGSTWRLIAVYLIKMYRLRGFNRRKYVVAGFGELSHAITSFYEVNPEMGYEFHGYFNKSNAGVHHNDLKGDLSHLEDFIQENGVDYVYCCLPYLGNDDLKKIIEVAERYKVHVMLIVDFRGFLTNKATIEYHDYMPVIKVSTEAYSNVRKEFFKRSFDIGFSSLVVLIGSPLFLLIALVVKFNSKGPAFFVQERSGRWGKTFNIIKFRSMYINADEILQKHSIGDGDPRITSVGKFLRKSRLDELPQFFNVIKGDMSVVGPRPLARYDVDMLMEESPAQFKRILTIRPGITSIGQIKVGYATDVSESTKRLKYDLVYLDNTSFKTDIWLIAQTVLLMLQRKGK